MVKKLYIFMIEKLYILMVKKLYILIRKNSKPVMVSKNTKQYSKQMNLHKMISFVDVDSIFIIIFLICNKNRFNIIHSFNTNISTNDISRI
jgi:hypothetical protein